jgi:hypothetical protein
VVTVDELVFGLRRRGSPRLDAWFDRFVDKVRVVDITTPIVRRAGELRALLQAHGQARTQADVLIAATRPGARPDAGHLQHAGFPRLRDCGAQPLRGAAGALMRTHDPAM